MCEAPHVTNGSYYFFPELSAKEKADSDLLHQYFHDTRSLTLDLSLNWQHPTSSVCDSNLFEIEIVEFSNSMYTMTYSNFLNSDQLLSWFRSDHDEPLWCVDDGGL